jgi:hypothetical protein
VSDLDADQTSGSAAYPASGPDASQASGSAAYQASGSAAYPASGPDAYQASGSAAYPATGPDAYPATDPDASLASGSAAYQATGPDAYQASGVTMPYGATDSELTGHADQAIGPADPATSAADQAIDPADQPTGAADQATGPTDQATGPADQATGPTRYEATDPAASSESTGAAVAGPTTGAARSAGYAAPLASSNPSAADDPLLPVAFSDRELRDAAGVRPRPEREPSRSARAGAHDDDRADGLDGDGEGDGDGPRKSRKMLVVGAFTTVIGLGIAALVLLGRVNKASFVIACKPQEVVAEQGRAFPPWGTRALQDDDKWKPIKIPPEAECRERETEDESELSGWYLDMLVERATALLTIREVTDYAGAATILEQALLHARAPERRDQRKEIERLLGDVGYWRASAKLRDASAALTEAAKLFDTAATQRPRHVSDASAWATYARKLIDDLRAGPTGAKQSPFPPLTASERPVAPAGTALPVEPEPAAGSATGNGTDTGSAAPPATPPDAGVPTGGVLL